MKRDDKLLTITEASNKFGLTRQAIFFCIRTKRLEAKKIKGCWKFSVNQWNEYRKNRYNRKFSTDENGDKIYGKEKGVYSPSMVAEMLGVNTQRIYYLIKCKIIPFDRIGHKYLITKETIHCCEKIIRNVIRKRFD